MEHASSSLGEKKRGQKGSALKIAPLVFVPLALELNQRLAPLKSLVQREAERGPQVGVGRRRVAAPMLMVVPCAILWLVPFQKQAGNI